MTTLRRLMVADYPIRVFLLALAAWSVAVEVCAQSPIKVGYYDMTDGAGIPEQVPPIVAAGFTPVLLENVAASNLAGLHILFVENRSPAPSVYPSEYWTNALSSVQDAVKNGLVLIIHDRNFTGSGNPLMGTRFILPRNMPAASGFPIVASGNFIDLTISDPATLVASSPHGTLTNTSLDNGSFSATNAAILSTLSVDGVVGQAKALVQAGANAVTFVYPLGQGFVIYSSIPLDTFLRNTSTAAPEVRDAFKNIYAPNVLTYAACGLKAFPATVSAVSATGHYGGTTTLSANVRCGVIPVAGVAVSFSLNGVPVGSAQTDATGLATFASASLGSSVDSAIAIGTYPSGVSASFGGTLQYGASSATAALTVEKAPASIAYDGGSFVYDATPHAATGVVTGVFGEPLGVPSFTYTDADGVTGETAPVNAGTYTVTATVSESAHYLETSSSSAKIKIAPAPLVITAEDETKTYGATVPVLNATYAGFVGNENASVLAGTLRLTTNATAASPVGEYEISPSGLTSRNYDLSFAKGTLAVTPAPLKIRADDKERLVGTPNPLLTVTYEGFVLDETENSLDRRPTVMTQAELTSLDGVYPILVSGAGDLNYTIDQVDGELTVSPEGRISGSGFVDAGSARHHFAFDARETIGFGEKGSLTMRINRDTGDDDVFVTEIITAVIFKNNPALVPGGKALADSVTLMGIGMWNGEPATFEATAADKGEPGVGYDTMTVKVRVDNRTVSMVHGTLSGGNVQSNRLPGR